MSKKSLSAHMPPVKPAAGLEDVDAQGQGPMHTFTVRPRPATSQGVASHAGRAHLAQELGPPITEQHQCKAVIDAIDGPVRQEGDEAADGGEHPDGRRITWLRGRLASFCLLAIGLRFQL